MNDNHVEIEKRTYLDIITVLYKQNGLQELFGRGLLLKILSDGIQGLFFTVIWKLLFIYQ